MTVGFNQVGYGYEMATFPSRIPLTARNTVTVTGSLPDSSGYDDLCLGAVEGTEDIGYMALFCNTSQWYIWQVTGLGTSSVVLGRQVATNSFPLSSGDSYSVSLSFRAGTATMTLNLTTGSGSPLTHDFPVTPFVPLTAGFAVNIGYAGLSADFPTVSGFIYAPS